ncbi:stalk domain-containing protein [Serpentinicella alkaliphila]|uniref:Copper amine oxidase-like protein n=1 Tax=Serpentinicella alkaliphila TaxID=1734049 RepID=A0A4R2TC43_9FIRM|nr:stalk domain-containing protein [Serpentinicella alkaliphila]QUH25055.1 Ig-like domain-containing protein [Serpentinicella alkaliphila]TCQ00501.1 copper amine oxidase-like protein [Serpentinicella alkaliphila]
MKRKISILLVLAMVLSMIPMMAFAEPSMYTTVASIDKTSITADGSDAAKITAFAFEANGNEDNFGVANPVSNFVVVSSRIGVDTVSSAVYTAGENKVEFNVRSTAAGNFKVAVALSNQAATPATLVNDVRNYLNGSGTLSAAQLGIVQVFDLTATAGTLDALTDVSTGLTGAGTQASPYTGKKANGIEYYELTFRLRSGNVPVVGQEVSFSTNRTAARLNKTTATTDAAGRVTVRVSSLIPGGYTVRASAGNQNKTVHVNFGATGVYTLDLVSGGNEVTAKDHEYKLEFALRDANGNKVNASLLTDTTAAAVAANATLGNFRVETVTKPSGSNLANRIYESANLSDYKFTTNASGNLELTIAGSRLNKEGDYVVKAYVDTTGRFIDIPFTVKKQGDVVKVTISYRESAVPLGATTSTPIVKRFDAAGVSVTLSDADKTNEMQFVLSDVRKGSLATTGAFTATTNDKHTGKVTVTAIDKENTLTATAVIEAGVEPSGLKLEVKDSAIVDKDITLVAQVLDANGNPIALGQQLASVTPEFFVIKKPNGSIVETREKSTLLTDMRRTGKSDITIASNKEGHAEIQVVITAVVNTPTALDPAATTTYVVSDKIEVHFGATPVVKEVPGAKSVVLTIDNAASVVDGKVQTLDVAPFIQNGRTFVPVRFIAEALGAEVSFTQNAQGLTDTVTLTREDKVVTMTIGATTLTVVADGKTTTVTSDVAPQVVSGRTVLPFRALAEAMGAEVDYGMKADNSGVAWVSFNQ